MTRVHTIRGTSLGATALGLAVLLSFLACGSPILAIPPQTAPALQDHTTDASIPDVVDHVSPAVVSIYSTRPVAVAVPPGFIPWGPAPRAEQSLGSGVIVLSDGVILTNNHVVDHAKDVRVVLNDRREFIAKVIGTDRKTDIAVLRIDAKDLPVMPFGDSSKMRIGETVIAVGNPLGVGQTVSRGIISAKGRANVGVTDYEDFLQTDAAINPGNSGGALVSLRGELIGINTAIASRTGGFQGIGFAIPSNMARQVMDLLIKEGRVRRGQMGVMIQDLTPALVAAMNGAPKEGVLVGDVAEKSPAEKAGLRRGDVVTQIDGEAVRSSSELRNRVALRGAGKEVRLTVWRNGGTKEMSVKLRAEPEEKKADEAEEAVEEGEPESRATGGAPSGLAGVRVTPATPFLLRGAELPSNLRGLFVTSVGPPASFAGLQEGDLILEVNRKAVESTADLRREVQDGPGNALLAVRRGPGTLFVAVPKESIPRSGKWQKGERF
ncbi:MAG TPA: Do family serine endopeptidase [Planctomycetota bacterium]|nr:Do family serine endopeptidase [Planctomycetota bacterium]